MILSPHNCSVKMSPYGVMETITLNLKEQKRLLVLNRVNDGKMTAAQAAELLSWSERHVRRMLARYRATGAEALAHGNQGRESERRIQPGQRSRIVSLAPGQHAGVNQQHLSELLNEREQLPVSRSTLRRILADAGMASSRPHRRRRRHRLRRERYRKACWSRSTVRATTGSRAAGHR